MSSPVDINGQTVTVGCRVRLIQLSGQWLANLPADEKVDVLSMIGEIFEVTEIDQYGCPWIGKCVRDGSDGIYEGHSISLEAHEMEIVDEKL